MILTPAEMRAIEGAAFATGTTTAEGLMDRVGHAMAVRLDREISRRGGTVLVYAGKGNNAGDALVVARALAEIGLERHRHRCLRIFLRLAGDPAGLGELPARKLAALPPEEFPRLDAEQVRDVLRDDAGDLFILDGLLGIGARGALRGEIQAATREINELRANCRRARVFALDVPTGVDAETGASDPDAIIADETWTVGFPKTGLLADAATGHVGRLRTIRLPEFDAHAGAAPDAPARGTVSTPETLSGSAPPRRPFDAHKGMFGRVGILAGSVGATGAAVMCSHACARAGAGLITLLVAREAYPIVAAAASPEVMVKPLQDPTDALEMPFDVLAVGPGLGTAGAGRVRDLIARWPKPMVVDADGLNALAEDLSPLKNPPGQRLLTPHPGEMARLLKGAGLDGTLTRAETVRAFTDRYPVTLLLKGARTVIGERGRPPAWNTTGNPGMGTGGMGDVLTGICAALLGQKLGTFDAARLGAWLHGRAADLALSGQNAPSEESLLPTDLFRHVGAAFRELHRGTS